MDVSLVLQYVVIALAALVSAWVVAKKQFPNATRKARVALALPMLREGRPAWLRSLGRKIAPPAAQSGAGACGGCSSCGPSTPASRKP
ncbi:hypothetical protein SAMN05428989_1189 [Pseudoxanthomonas sp. GM95]|uniref:DUF6587 family protein n=1 Tax=Pseudoxanthomonas sp. GM95 TaxID=1881043 RepID=UPI0008C72FD5|nr:DUF6587 family protein [Pseudoxanthomonas sp. GM95]SEK97682.1 hypothetical protein SAMN05428989_1189 [Pseudoxanthomonas sp. GM95]